MFSQLNPLTIGIFSNYGLSEIHRDSLWYHVQERKWSNPVAEIIKMLKSCIYNYTGHFIRYDCWTLQSNQPIIWQQFSRHGQNSLLRLKPRVRIGNKGHFNDWLFRYKGIFPDNHLYGLQRIVQQKKKRKSRKRWCQVLNHLKMVLWTWQSVHSLQTASTKSWSNRPAPEACS